MTAVRRISWALRGGLALIFTLAHTAGMSPIWLIKALLQKRSTSQSPNALQWYLTYTSRAFLYWMAFFRCQPFPNTRTPSRFRDRLLGRTFTWIEPAPLASHGGTVEKTTLAFDDSKLPVPLKFEESQKRTAGLWFLNRKEPYDYSSIVEKSKRRSPVLLYFHGGAYITLEAGDVFMGLTLGKMQSKHAELDMLSVNYRLAPGSKHPTQLYEAFNAWRHLRTHGYKEIFLGGDSAGANLALTLWKYLDQVANDSNAVKGMVLHSPWVDMNGHKNPRFRERCSTCLVTELYVTSGLRAMQSGALPKPDDAWISPSVWDAQTLSRLPPILVTNGGAETLLDEANEFIRRARQSKIKVEHFVLPDHPHDVGAIPWFYPSSRRMFRIVGEWVRGVAGHRDA